jgi:hypothetical protein
MTQEVHLPKGIRAQLDQAQAIRAQLDQEQLPVEEPNQGAAAESDESDVPERVEATPAQPVEQKEAQPDATLWEQRYKSYKGHADAELARMQQAMREAQQAQQQLAQQVEAMQAQLASTKEQPKEAVPEITREDIDNFGEDMVQFVDRAVRKGVHDAQQLWVAERESLVRYVRDLESSLQGVNQTVAKTAQERFYESLAHQVPDWEAVNADQGFLDWLGETDPLSGATRQALLTQAAKAGDVARTANFFNTYKASTGASTATSGGTRAQQRSELERQVAPAKSGSSARTAPATSAESRIWTQADIAHFYDQKWRGKVSAEDATRTEQEIHQAVISGRVR